MQKCGQKKRVAPLSNPSFCRTNSICSKTNKVYVANIQGLSVFIRLYTEKFYRPDRFNKHIFVNNF